MIWAFIIVYVVIGLAFKIYVDYLAYVDYIADKINPHDYAYAKERQNNSIGAVIWPVVFVIVACLWAHEKISWSQDKLFSKIYNWKKK